MPSIKRIAIVLMAMLAIAPFATKAVGQQRGPVDCGNGFYCPAGNACLVGGLCAREADAPPGAVRLANGLWCDPGFREHEYRPGHCRPETSIACRNGLACPEGSTCAADGGCDGGPPATGPVCGAKRARCLQGRICSSRRTCMNPQYHHDCGNGTICTHATACEHPRGCVYVSGERTPQLKR